MPPKNPKRKCSCKQHDRFRALYPDEEENVYRIDAKKVKAAVIEFLIKHQCLFQHSTFICSVCAKYAEQQIQICEDAPTTSKRKFDISHYFDDIVDAIRDGKFTIEQLGCLAFEIAKSQCAAIFTDSSEISKDYKDDLYLQTFQLKEWFQKRNTVVNQFVKGFSSVDTDDFLPLVKSVEQIYNVRNPSFVSPMSFAQNLLVYFISGSKSAVQIGSKGSPCGSYSTLLNWIDNHSKVPVDCPKDADVVSFFDNNQVLEKKWKVEINYKSQSSVITTLVHIVPPKRQQLQLNADLSPEKWMDMSESGKRRCVEKMTDIDQQQFEHFRSYRNKFIENIINQVYGQQVCNGGTMTDPIDKKEPIIGNISSSDKYDFVTSCHSGTTQVTMGEPCFENPCSYESVEKVFDHILKQTEVGTLRAWTIIGCDGLPYTLGSRLIDSTFIYHDCYMEFMSMDDFNDHRARLQHGQNASHNSSWKYKDIMMLPGLGHYEINMTKAIFRLLWNVGLVDLAKLLGFESPKALASCMSATNHHKSWQILQIFLHGMAAELLIPYVRDSTSDNTPSIHDYYKWLAKVKNKNYMFMTDAVFTYCYALHLFRAGVRKNNSTAINAAKTKFSPLFFGLNMPNYIETYVRDSFVRIQCPLPVKEFVEGNESFSVSGNESKGEGGDYVLEAKNRRTKMWIPAGVPSNDKWLSVCRNIDRLDKVRKNIVQSIGIGECDADYIFTYDINNEITKFREFIRHSKYLDSPFTSTEHVSMSGHKLDESLHRFHNYSVESRKDFLQFCIMHDLKDRRKNIQPLFILADERTKYFSLDNKTKTEISRKVSSKLSSLGNTVLDAMWKTVKTKCKADILSFYKDIESMESDETE